MTTQTHPAPIYLDGAVRESGYVSRMLQCLEVLDPPPFPIHTRWEPPNPPVAVPRRTPSQPTPSRPPKFSFCQDSNKPPPLEPSYNDMVPGAIRKFSKLAQLSGNTGEDLAIFRASMGWLKNGALWVTFDNP